MSGAIAPRTSRLLIVTGGISGLLAVAAGAFGAHVLRARLAPDLLAIFETGARYHLVHSAVLVLAALLVQRSPRAARVAGWSFCAGIVIFSGSLYALALSGARWLGAITPLGGLALLVGWGALAACARNLRSS